MGLKKSAVDALAYWGDASKNEKCILWADEPSGFGVRVYPSGKKSFVLDYRSGGRKQLKTIGKYGDITVKQAEDQARKDIVGMLEGKNPLAEKRKALMGKTIKDLCITYIEKKASIKKTGVEDIRRINRHILPAWNAHKIKSITRQDVAALHSRIGKTAPYEANRVLALVSSLFSSAVKWGMVDDGFVNPTNNVDRFKESSRDRFVTPQEMPRLIEAIDKELNQPARFALWLYLLTGLRKEELLTARWCDIDYSRNEIRIADTKNGKVHYLPLSLAALAILEKVPRIEGNPYIITGKIEGHHLVNIDKAWQRVRKQAGVEDVHIHDLRRSVGSWLAQSGNSLHLIGKVLNHTNVGTTAVYARFGQDHVREALDRHGEQIMAAAGLREDRYGTTHNKD